MVAAFNVELPFPVRDTRRRRLSLSEVQNYRDIALTRGHAGNALKGVKNAFAVGSVEAARLADIMRQVDISAAGSLGRQDFFLALDRAGVSLEETDREKLFLALQSAGTGRGCDIEMFAQLVKFWAGREDGVTAPRALVADQTSTFSVRPGSRLLPSPSNQTSIADSRCVTDEAPPWPRVNTHDTLVQAEEGGHSTHISPGYTMRSEHEEEGSRELRSDGDCSGGVTSSENNSEDFHRRPPAAVRGAATATMAPAAGKKNSFSNNMLALLNHSTGGKEDECFQYGSRYRHGKVAAATAVTATHLRAATPTKAVGSHTQSGNEVHAPTFSPDATLKRLQQEAAAGEDEACNGSADASALDKCFVEERRDGVDGERQLREPPDEAYMHSLGYGNLSSVLPILLGRRGALEASVERLDISGTGRVRPSDFMAAVRQVGIALSPVQQSNMMDLLERMGCASLGDEGSDTWVAAKAAVAAIALAGEKSSGGRMLYHDKSPSSLEEGTRLVDAVSDHYSDVHISLLPSSILLGPAALRERRAAAGDGTERVFVTSGSLRKALRNTGVLLGDADERTLWRQLLRRAQQKYLKNDLDGGRADGNSEPQEIYLLLERGMIPLPVLDDIMGFDAKEALRTRRHAHEQPMPTVVAIPAPYRDQLGPQLAPVTPARKGGSDEEDEAPVLLQKARLRVNTLGSTTSEREQALVALLPKLGPTGERQRLPRTDLTRLLQRLRVGVRSGELQNLWYHMDRNKVTRMGFRRILLDTEDSLPVTFPASPCPYPAAAVPPATPNGGSYNCDPDDSTIIGRVSLSGARLQCKLNRAAYEANVRRGAGSGVTYGICEGIGNNASLSLDSPSQQPPGNGPEIDPGLPVLLARAIEKLRRMENNGEEVAAVLVPDVGRGRESTRMSRGGIQRVLHGLGVIPRSGELRQLWWALEKGGVGGPRITVEEFRKLLQGRIGMLKLLPDWTYSEDGSRHGRVERLVGSSGGFEDSHRAGGPDNASENAVREVRTALGLVRRRVCGVIRGCQDRDLMGDGWVSAEGLFAVLKEQGILQQLGDIGRSALYSAMVVDSDLGASTLGGKSERVSGSVRYTGIVGAIDDYIERLMAGDVDNASIIPRGPPVTRTATAVDGGKPEPAAVFEPPLSPSTNNPAASSPTSPNVPQMEHRLAATRGGAITPTTATSGATRDRSNAMNTAARATWGWEDDAPEVPLGMRHYPQRQSMMATIVGGGGGATLFVSGADTGDEKAKRRDQSFSSSPGGGRTPRGSTAVTGGSRGAGHTSSPSSQTKLHSPAKSPDMRELLDWGDHFEAQHEGCSFPRQPPAKVHIQGHADPAPAGGNAGLVSPPGTSKGRRGSLGKAVSLAGGGAAEAFCWGQEMEDKTGRQDDGREMEQVPPRTDPSPHADDKRPQSRRLFDGDESPGGGIERENGSVECDTIGYSNPLQHTQTPASAGRQRHFKTDGLRELTEAWPKASSDIMDHNGSNDGNYPHNAAADDPGRGVGRGDGGNQATHRAGLGNAKASKRRAPCDAGSSLLYDPAHRIKAAQVLLSDRALLAGIFRQLSGVGGGQVRDGLDRGGLEQLFRDPRLKLGLSQHDAQELTNAALAHAGGQETVRFPSLTTFLIDQAEVGDWADGHFPPGRFDPPVQRPIRLTDDPIAQSIATTVRQGRSELRLAGGDEGSRFSCAVHLRNAFRKRRKNLGGDPGGIDDCSVGASDLSGLLQDMGVFLNTTQAAFLIQKCCPRQILRARDGPGGKTETPVRAGDVLEFFRQVLSE